MYLVRKLALSGRLAIDNFVILQRFCQGGSQKQEKNQGLDHFGLWGVFVRFGDVSLISKLGKN